jgi:aryl-alcohol dehydrogenase-like predicted oxidoreductase
MSSIGLGTYLGQWDEHTDRSYQDAVKRAVELGCNVFDSAINYRFQRSERSVGAALAQLFAGGQASRDEIVVATKGGFLAYDGAPVRDSRGWVTENIVDRGLATWNEIAGGCHCMTPAYLEDSVGLDEFDRRVRAAFEFLEQAADEGRIQYYGTATWNGYRQKPGSVGSLSLAGLVNIARQVAGEGNRFRVIQLPHNLLMPEALTSDTQEIDGENISVLMAAEKLDITVMCSASISQAKLSGGLPPFVAEALTGLNTDTQRAIQFVRSTPGVTTALVGMSKRSHVDENLMTARVPPAPIEKFFSMFSSSQE